MCELVIGSQAFKEIVNPVKVWSTSEQFLTVALQMVLKLFLPKSLEADGKGLSSALSSYNIY